MNDKGVGCLVVGLFLLWFALMTTLVCVIIWAIIQVV